MIKQLFGSTSPVFEVDGSARGELARDIVRLEVEESISGLKTLCLRLVAFGSHQNEEEPRLLYLDGAILDFGKAIDVSIGMPPNPKFIFHGRISGLEASFEEAQDPEVIVFAEDRLMDFRMTRRMKTYENMTDGEIAQEIADQHGIQVEVDADGPSYDVVQQWNVSDLAFLRERARRIQAEVWVERDKLFFQSRLRRRSTDITLVRGNELTAVHIRADLAHQRTEIHVSGFSAADRAGFDESAGEDAISAEITGGRTGPAILAGAFGQRISHRVRDVPLKSGEAADWARAEMLRRCRSFVQAVGVTNGTPEMTIGSRVTLERVGTPFEGGGYYVTRMRHCYDLTGYRTYFEAERATVEENG